MALKNLAREQTVFNITAGTAHVTTTDVYRNNGYSGLALMVDVTADGALTLALTPRLFWDFPSGATATYLYSTTTSMTAIGEFIYIYAPVYVAGGGTATEIDNSTLPRGDFRFEMRHGNSNPCDYTVDVVMFK